MYINYCISGKIVSRSKWSKNIAKTTLKMSKLIRYSPIIGLTMRYTAGYKSGNNNYYEFVT